MQCVLMVDARLWGQRKRWWSLRLSTATQQWKLLNAHYCTKRKTILGDISFPLFLTDPGSTWLWLTCVREAVFYGMALLWVRCAEACQVWHAPAPCRWWCLEIKETADPPGWTPAETHGGGKKMMLLFVEGTVQHLRKKCVRCHVENEDKARRELA